MANEATPPPAEFCVGFRERLYAMQSASPKHATGVEELDYHLRGGIREGEVMVIGGAPGAGKSTLALQIARNFARRGVVVGWLAVDESPAGLDARNLQAELGVTREEAEKPCEDTIRRALARMSELDFPLYIYDADATVEDVFKGLAELPQSGPRCIIIDSLQTARTQLSADFDNPRQRVDELFNWCKRAARLPGQKCVLIFTSELARGAYRSKRSAENSDPLASFKESGTAEYGVDVALVLSNVRGESDLVQAELVKCRPGDKGTFNLELDRDRATFNASHRTPDDVKAAEDSRFAFCKLRVLEHVTANPGCTTRAIRGAVGGSAGTINDALTDLTNERKIEDRGKGQARSWFPTGTPVLTGSHRFSEPVPVDRYTGSPPLRGNRFPEPVEADELNSDDLERMADEDAQNAAEGAA